MRTALLLLLAFAATTTFANSQSVWKWVDEKGITHYSDRPVPGATRVELNLGTRPSDSSPPLSQPPTPFAGVPDEAPSDAQRERAYRNFEIWKPANDESIVNTGGAVTINLRVDPQLDSGHTLRLFLDGRPVEGFAPNATTYDMTNVPRGTHVAVGQIFDESGRRLQETAPVTFHVRQESIAKPPVGPTLRPPPKPQPRAGNKLPAAQPSYQALNGAPPVIDPRTNRPVVAPPKDKGSKSGK